MEIKETFNELFQSNLEVSSLPEFIISMAGAALLGAILAQVYIKFGQSLSNRKSLARNFLMLAVTTTLIISIVKSSLALSLGLVGALSIVRFRAAIKEPEELTYLFLAIGVGLGMGANQFMITGVAFVIIVAIIIVSRTMQTSKSAANLFITVNSNGDTNMKASDILELLTNAGAQASLKRTDDKPESFEASFLVDFKDIDSLEKFKAELQKNNPGVSLTCMDHDGLTA
ncbi:MAG: DUF4956 domain-containing protein [Fulvivirga sp.]|nr:DUF4956 domain-containing protein [Fulvivirga sp.]